MEMRRFKVRFDDDCFVGDQILAKSCDVFGYGVGSSIIVGIVES